MPPSRDATPMDYSIWGHLKQQLNKTRIDYINELKKKLLYEWQKMSQRYIDKVRPIRLGIEAYEIIMTMQIDENSRFTDVVDDPVSSTINAPSVVDKSNTSAQSKHITSSETFSKGISLKTKTKWKQQAITVAGGNDYGKQLNQLSNPHGIFIDDNTQSIYIADRSNNRIVEWKLNGENGRIVAGGNGDGKQISQLYWPIDVIINRENNSLIISDQENRRIWQWSRQNNADREIIIEDIDCWGLAKDKNGYLYVSDYKKNEVRRWKIGNKNGTLIAGGNGKGDQLNQLDHPTCIFIDENYALYVSDTGNHRVMKWEKDAREGIVVAGGNGFGSELTQFACPQGVTVDQCGQIYVADRINHRVMCWSEGDEEGSIVVGGNGQGEESNKFCCPSNLSFDLKGNLYVADSNNHRIQMFEVD